MHIWKYWYVYSQAYQIRNNLYIFIENYIWRTKSNVHRQNLCIYAYRIYKRTLTSPAEILHQLVAIEGQQGLSLRNSLALSHLQIGNTIYLIYTYIDINCTSISKLHTHDHTCISSTLFPTVSFPTFIVGLPFNFRWIWLCFLAHLWRKHTYLPRMPLF